MPRLPIPPSAPQVWAVEDTSIQLTWGLLPPGVVEATLADPNGQRRTVSIDHAGGPGTVELAGLIPTTPYGIELVSSAGTTALSASTLPSPGGRSLCRIATISDLHLGSRRWGFSKTMVDRSGRPDPFPMRCARAAINEAIEWGAELLIVKGDGAHHQAAFDFNLLGELLDEFPELPVLLIPGNHDVDGRTDDPVPAKVGARGIPFVRNVAVEDLPGLRVIVADSTVPGSGSGSVDRIRPDVVELAAETGGPYLLALHHQLQSFRWPTAYPPGIPAPSSTELVADLIDGNPRGLVTSGHTHRNRARRHGPLVATEVGSTRDWPGVWAGYAVHEEGIRQVVRRAAAPGAITWHEYSRNALLGWWSKWAVGRLDQRCFTHRWPAST